VVRETFGVSNVVARIYDPDRAQVYERLGIATVQTVPWAADQVMRAILPGSSVGVRAEPSGKISLMRFAIHPGWVAAPLTQIEAVIGGRTAFVSRFGEPTLPQVGQLYQSGDVVHFLVPTSQVDAAERRLGSAPQEEDA
jgi:trk system potassium uptake protein TrkA